MKAVLPLLLLCATLARGHEFWLQPSSFAPATGSVVTLQWLIGDNLQGIEYPRDEGLIDRFVFVGPPGWQVVAGDDGDKPAGHATVGGDGLYLAGYRSTRMFVELKAAEFEEYLWKEGLEHIVRLRHARGERTKPGREFFSRCAKTLIAGGAGATNGYERVLGLRLEIIPEKNPLSLSGGGDLPVRVLFDGKPCPDLLVAALGTRAPGRPVQARTGADGRVRLALPQRDTWLVKTVHIFPAPDPHDADWESLWATFLFSPP